MEFVVGATAACGACLISNPLDVLKTRMQLQGELRARGHYTVVYRNIIHAAYAVAKVSGLTKNAGHCHHYHHHLYICICGDQQSLFL